MENTPALMKFDELPPIVIPGPINYIAVFLTFSCMFRCTYCINFHGGDLVKGRRLNVEEWTRGLNRLVTRPDLPLTIQGGEPTTYKGFYEVINQIRTDSPIDLLTNLEVDATTFEKNIPNSRLKRVSPYASIRVSYHHGQSDFKETTDRVKYLKDKGYSIGIWEVDHPAYHGEVIHRQQVAHSMGIDYRLKEFLGPYEGEVHGTMRYEGAVNSHWLRHCECRTSEMLIDPSGNIFRCHSDLYANRSSIGSLLDPDFNADRLNQWKPCAVYGKCNSCDVKIKTDRHQRYNWTSVEIKDIGHPYAKNPDHVAEVVNTYGKK